MWAALLPILEALGIGGVEAIAARAGVTGTEAMAAKQSASLAGEESAASSGSVETAKLKQQKEAFDNLFEPTKAEKDEKEARERQEAARKEKERKSDPGHQKATEWLQKAARYTDEKSVGQGMFDWIKKNDKSGIAGLAMAGMDLGASVSARGMNASGKVIGDDFRGLADEILPDSLKKVIHAFDDLTKRIVEKGRYLARYSAQLTQATAQSDVRQIQADFREAQGPGREYSRVINESSKLETTLRDAFNPMKEAIASGVANVLELVNRLIEISNVEEMLRVLGEIAKVAAKFLTFDPIQILEAVVDLPEAIWKAWFKERSKEDPLKIAIENARRDMRRQPGAIVDERDFGNGRFNFPVASGV